MSEFPHLMTVPEFIQLFNESVSSSVGANKLYALVREKDFPAVKIGGRYYVLADRINDWLEQQINEKRGKTDD